MTYSDEQIDQALARVGQKLGRGPTVHEYQERRRVRDPSGITIIKRRGSWNAALESVGLETNRPGTAPRPRISDDKILEAMRKAAEHFHPEPLTYARYDEVAEMFDGPSAVTCRYRFGSWLNAKKKAGVV